jgi:hypothetical protein
MSHAWETTVEDVQNVLRGMGMPGDEKSAQNVHRSLDMTAIEKAALHGDNMDRQTEYACQEIKRQIKETA